MSSEITSFIDKAKESLVASELLSKNGLYDFAASRAYYTMFYIAEAFLWSKGLSFSSHAAIISAFGKEIAKKGIVPIELHRYLIDAQDKRTQADYGIDEDLKLDNDSFQKLLDQSKLFIEWGEKALL
ncbi:MAG: HEPN domain-containing protein [Prochlorotrichaceae cyanobacterium]|jgi:uncharacterized protein (UPF0332 family)